jgi:hypothetical protein
MGTGWKRQEGQNQWLPGAGWVAGIGIALVEMRMGMDYVLASVTQHLAAVVGWLPVIGTMVARFWGHSAG